MERVFRHKTYLLITSALFVHNLFRTHKYLVTDARLVLSNAVMSLTISVL